MISLCGCAGSIRQEKTVFGAAGTSQGQWRGKAYVQSLRDGKSGTLDLDIIAHEPSQLRIEATGSFDVALASIALNGSTVRILLPREKKFIIAPASSDTLSRLVSVSISAADLMSLLFDRALEAQTWNCVALKGSESLLADCRKKDGSVSIHWDRSDPKERRMKFTSSNGLMELHLVEAKSQVEISNDIYNLSAPAGYRLENKN